MLRKINISIFVLIFLLALGVDAVNATPYLSTNYYCLVDTDTGQVIYSQGLDEKRPVASTTKMMTAILAVEYANLDEVAIVSEHASKTPEFSIGLRKGSEVEVAELVKAALIRSSNDTAVVLAEHIAGDESLFAHLMNKKAFAIGAVNTHFINSSGLPATNHYSTTYDLSVIGRYLLTKEEPRKIVAMAESTFQHPDYIKPLKISTTNRLLNNYSGANGIKTGTTNLAGKCLVASATRDGRNLIAVTLKSGDRVGDCMRLLDYGFYNTKYVKIIDGQIPFKRLKVNNGEKPYMEVYPSQDLYLWQADNKLDLEKKVRINYMPEVPVLKGTIHGYLDVYVDNKLMKSIPLVNRENIKKKNNTIQKIREFLIK
ncbi:MAG TPA: D-alanyl-D-alanine carboxypeptidase family protein [Syntrophomonadaceae bacterium]|nr:D-alanyl-D-alanine carboxypeptidase family protein [Syntrophomonadaceae bacterium]